MIVDDRPQRALTWDTLTVSFVIINKNDLGIADTLSALGKISETFDGRAEIVVVDASDDRLARIRERFTDVRWIPFIPKPGKPTIPEQRNVGVRASEGDVVVFIDASCVPEEGWIERLLAPIVNDGELIAAGSHRSAGKAGIRDEDVHFAGAGTYLREAPTMNLAVVRDVFDAVGPFDESFSYGSDVDFTWRANDAGFRVRNVPEASVVHDWGDASSDYRRSFTYGKARYRLYSKHRGRVRSVLRHDPTAVIYPVYMLLLPFAVRRPWIVALLAVPLAKNVRHRPLLTVAHHFAFGAGVLAAAWDDVRPAA